MLVYKFLGFVYYYCVCFFCIINIYKIIYTEENIIYILCVYDFLFVFSLLYVSM